MANSADSDQLASEISWLLQKPTDPDLHFLQSQGITLLKETRVKIAIK